MKRGAPFSGRSTRMSASIPDLTLYTYFRSSAAFRVRIALNLKGQEVQQRFVSLLRHEQADETYRALNPQSIVPTLVHNGQAIGQSLAIIEYLEEIAPNPPLLPPSPPDRAKVRQMALTIACEVHPLCNLRVREYLAKTMDQEQLTVWQHHWIGLGLAAVEAMVGDSRFCFGPTVTLADICLVPQLYNARRVGLDLSAYPKLTRIEAAAYEFAAFQDAHPDRQSDAA